MASSKGRYLYWDSNVFLAYINQETNRIDIIDDLWEEMASENGSKIVTSTTAIVEVAAAAQERSRKKLDTQIEARIDSIWTDPTVLLVESPEIVMRIAKDLIRTAIPAEWVLHPKDAIHLATAVWLDRHAHPIAELHTYDRKLEKFSAMVGFKICEPSIMQPKLLKTDI